MQYADPSIHSDPIAPVIFGVTLILTAALVGRYGARRLGQASVLGELTVGVILGNLLYFFDYELMVVLREGTACLDIARLAMAGSSWDDAATAVLGPLYGPQFLAVVRGQDGGDYLQIAQAVDIFSRYGVIFLLFHVGLDTCISELRQVGRSSTQVAVIGVVVPFALGYAVSQFATPVAGEAQHLFIGATLGATSVGITARVLADLRQSHSQEAHVILGAAVIDDVLGLIMLAIVSGIVVRGSVSLPELFRTVALSILFISSVLMLGPRIIRMLTRLLRHLELVEAKIFVSFIFVMTLAWFANLVGLATIVGAFAAGLLMLDQHFTAWGDHHQHRFSIKELFAPIETILVPIFFVLMGIQVKLEMFLDWPVILTAIGLTLAAAAGKVVAGIGAQGKVSRLAIGIGMMPRGEVGLVFASIGKALGVVDPAMFSAVVLMVMATTLATPPLLTRTLSDGGPEGESKPHSRLCD